jgi:RNA-binding protein YhbY
MLAIVHLTTATPSDPTSLAALVRLATQHELVLICDHRAVTRGLIPAIRRTLPHHRLLAITIDDEVVRQERELVEQLLEEGSIPLILTSGDTATSRPTSWTWVGADVTMTLPPETAAAA